MRTFKMIVGALLLMAATACSYYDDTTYRHRYYAYTTDDPVYHRHYYAYGGSYPDYYSYDRATP